MVGDSAWGLADGYGGKPVEVVCAGAGTMFKHTESRQRARKPAWRRVMRTRAAPPRRRSTAQKPAPAVATWTPAPSTGGMVSTMIRIARHVEPRPRRRCRGRPEAESRPTSAAESSDGGRADGVALGPVHDHRGLLDHLAGVGHEHGHGEIPRQLLDLLAPLGVVEKRGKRRQAVGLDDLWVVAGVLERAMGVPAGVAARPGGRGESAEQT